MTTDSLYLFELAKHQRLVSMKVLWRLYPDPPILNNQNAVNAYLGEDYMESLLPIGPREEPTKWHLVPYPLKCECDEHHVPHKIGGWPIGLIDVANEMGPDAKVFDVIRERIASTTEEMAHAE